MKPGPQHRGIDLSTSNQSSQMADLTLSCCSRRSCSRGTFGIWYDDWAAGLQGCEENHGGGCLFLWKGLGGGTSLCYILYGDGFQSCTLGKQWGMPVPKTQLLGSWICFVSFPHVHKALKGGKRVIAHKPTFSLWFFKRLCWDTLCKDLALTTFTPDFSFQPISLSDFVLSMQSQSELFIYSRRCSRLYKLAVITEWGARPLARSSCTGALSCCSTERSPSGEGNDAVPGRRRDRGSNPWAKKQQLIFSTVQSAAWQPQLPNTV